MNDSTLYYYNKALDSALQYGDESWIAHICNNVSILYFNIRQLNEAEKYTDMAAEHAARTEDPFVAFTTWQIRATIKAELNKLDDAEKSNRKAWNIACHGEGNEDLWKIRCLPGMLRLFERKEQPDSIDHYLKLGNKLLQRVPSNSIAAIGFIQSRAATETNRKNYARALKDFHWLRNRKTGTEPKTLFTQMTEPQQEWTETIESKHSLVALQLKEVWRYRDLVYMFVKLDFVSGFKQTILGPIWFFINPSFTTIVFVFVFILFRIYSVTSSSVITSATIFLLVNRYIIGIIKPLRMVDVSKPPRITLALGL